MTLDVRLQKIADAIGEENLLIQLAEEASELSQACLKLVRCKRGLTPVPMEDAVNNLAEEISDVSVCMDMLLDCREDIREQQSVIRERKTERWYRRTFVSQHDDGGLVK